MCSALLPELYHKSAKALNFPAEKRCAREPTAPQANQVFPCSSDGAPLTPKISLSSETSSPLPPGQHPTSHEQEVTRGRDVLLPGLPSITSWQSHPYAGLQPSCSEKLEKTHSRVSLLLGLQPHKSTRTACAS